MKLRLYKEKTLIESTKSAGTEAYMSNNSKARKIIGSICLGGVIVAVFTYMGMQLGALQQQEKNYSLDAKKVAYTTPPTSTPLPDLTPTVSPAPGGGTTGAYTAVEDVVADALNGVVAVSAATIKVDDYFSGTGAEKWAVGSGIIASDKGYIITNQHVVGSNPSQLKVTLSNGRIYDAKVMWTDSALDLAVIKVDSASLTPIRLGDAKACRVGQSVMAIGNPLGLQFQRTVTRGVISALNRTISTEDESGSTIYMEDLLQTDASINPGNSGGPLINDRGEVVGINTIKVSEAEGIGFAIPINILKPIIASFEKSNSFTPPYFGVFAYDRSMADYINQSFDQKVGIYVVSVDPGSPAERLGIKKGDVITHVNRMQVDTMMDFRSQIYAVPLGNEITVSYITKGTLLEAKVILDQKR